MERNINDIGLNQILPLFICNDLSDSMRKYILNHTCTYSFFEDYDTGYSYYSFIDRNGHEIARLKSRNYESMLLGFDDTNTFELIKFEKSKYSYYSEDIDKAIRRINDERVKTLNETLVILQKLLKPEIYERTAQFAFCTHVWKTPEKHIVFTSELKKVIVIQYNPNSNGSYDIVYFNDDIYSDLLN